MASAAESFARRRVRLGNVEPAAVALLRQLEPLIVLLSLFLSEIAYGGHFTPALGAYATLLFILTGHLFGLLDTHSARQSFSNFSGTYARVLVQWGTTVALLLFGAFVFKFNADLSRRVLLTWFITTPVVLSVTQAVRARANWFASHGAKAPRHIIIGVNEVGFELARRLPARGFLGYFDFRSMDRLAHIGDPEQLRGHCKDVADYVRAQNVNVVYIALPISNVPRMSELINALRDTTASVYFVPDAFAFDLIQGRLVEIDGMPALSICDTPFHGMDAVLKRTMDLALATLAVVVLSPIMLVISAAVKGTSKGPVIFRQRRYGLNGDEIMVSKFRSMVTTDDGPVVKQATRSDPRVTRVGQFIRRTSLDELPQLFNVLRGTMSLVGPRPHAVAHNEEYRKLISGYMIRHKVRPGMTGLAQVNGQRGETDTLDKMAERVRIDLEYLRRWSPWLDIEILFMTVWIVVRGSKNAY